MKRILFFYQIIFIFLFLIFLFLPFFTTEFRYSYLYYFQVFNRQNFFEIFFAEFTNHHNFFEFFSHYSMKWTYQTNTLFNNVNLIHACSFLIFVYLLYRCLSLKKYRIYPFISFIVLLVDITLYYLLIDTFARPLSGFKYLLTLFHFDFLVNLILFFIRNWKNEFGARKVVLTIILGLFIFICFHFPFQSRYLSSSEDFFSDVTCAMTLGCIPPNTLHVKEETIWRLYRQIDLLIPFICFILIKFTFIIRLEKYKKGFFIVNSLILLQLLALFYYKHLYNLSDEFLRFDSNAPILRLICIILIDFIAFFFLHKKKNKTG